AFQAITNLNADSAGSRFALLAWHQEQYKTRIPGGIADLCLSSHAPSSENGECDLGFVPVTKRRERDHGDFGPGGLTEARDQRLHLRFGSGVHDAGGIGHVACRASGKEASDRVLL